MLCTYIYFVDIGSFVGDEIPPPPNDPGVYHVHKEMAEVEDQGDRTGLDQTQILAGVRHGPDT